MNLSPERLSSVLRMMASRIEAPGRPSRRLVALELRRVLAAIGPDSVAAGPTKVVVSESWTLEEVQALAPEFGGTDIRTGPYGDVGLMVPADKVDAVQEGGGEFHVFDSWEQASGGDPEYAFEPVSGHTEDLSGGRPARPVSGGMNKITVNKVALVPDEPGDEPGMPTFLVDLTWMGNMCEYLVSVELDGRDAEWEYVGGEDPNGDVDAATWGEWTSEQVTVYEAIYATDDYKRLVAEHEAVGP